MAALFALGVMSLTWMIVIAALVAIEKLLPWNAVTVGAMVLFIAALGLGVAFAPGHVPGLTIPM
jgi:predicted metal-binding membrane protein